MRTWITSSHKSGSHRVNRDASLSDGQQLYHMLQWRHARKIFKESRFRLCPVSSWPDPYERWWHERIFGDSGAPGSMYAHGLCWTTRTFDEPLWRLAAFGRTDPIVRIRCSVQGILHAALRWRDNRAGTFYLGRVRYCRQSRLTDITERQQEEAIRTEQAIANLLFCKRSAFRFENEVRLLWLSSGREQSSLSLDIHPKSTITQVMISPYVTKDAGHRMQACLKEWGIPCQQSRVMSM